MTSMGTLETHHPADLALYYRNPKVGDVDAIAASLRVNHQYRPIVVNRGTHTGREMEVLAGNHTLKAFRNLAEKHPEEDTWQFIDCYVIDVDDDRAARIVAADNRTAELGSMDDRLLLELLSDLDDLDGTGYDLEDLNDLEAAINDDWPDEGEEGGDGENPYTDRDATVQYEPSGDCPPLSKLVDTSRTDELVQQINEAEIPEDVKAVLRTGAQRHTVIDFRHMADYYAHATPAVQRLMEEQALIILDVDDAIKRGFARLEKELTEQAAEEHPDKYPPEAVRYPDGIDVLDEETA